jgi:cell division protein ZapA (FtsZ GTPase activity inhibitor)
LEQLVTIEIFGRPYTFKAESETTKAKEVVDFLKSEITKVETQQSDKSPGITKLAILILAALNIANENFDLKMNHSKLLEQISERSTGLIRTLDDYLQ